MYFSKSKYCSFWQCPKIVWLDKYKPEEKEVDESALGRMKSGNEVGDLAMGLFGDYTEVTACSADGKLNLDEMKRKTAECIARGEENICEASFDYNGLYCAVDILHKENGGYAIYEVKSATKLNYYYLVDVAYQKYVLEKCGVKVTGTYVVCINNEYVRRGEIDVKKLFNITDVKDLIADEYEVVERNLTSAENLLRCVKSRISTSASNAPYLMNAPIGNTAQSTCPNITFSKYTVAIKNGNFIKTVLFRLKICKSTPRLIFCNLGKSILRLMTEELMSIIDL